MPPEVIQALDRRRGARILPYRCWPISRVIDRLYEAPCTTSELAELINRSSQETSRLLILQRKRGRVVRIDGRSGPGTIAVYALSETCRAAIDQRRQSQRRAA